MVPSGKVTALKKPPEGAFTPLTGQPKQVGLSMKQERI